MENMGFGKKNHKKGLITKTWERCRSLGSSSSGFLTRSGSGNPRSGGFLTRSGTTGSTGKTALSIFPTEASFRMPRSWPCTPDWQSVAGAGKRKSKRGAVPEGCFAVYVGSERQRFVIKTSCINHPLFTALLEEAELVYGYHSEGPLVLPCDVGVFYRVLSAMDDDGDEVKQGCSFAKGHGSYHHLVSPSGMVAADPLC